MIAHNSPVVFDGDNTLWKGRVAEGIGLQLITRELKRMHLSTVVKAVRKKSDVNEVLRAGVLGGGSDRESVAQNMFYDFLVQSKKGNKELMYKFAGNYIEKHLTYNVLSLISNRHDWGGELFLATCAGTSAAQYVKDAGMPNLMHAWNPVLPKRIYLRDSINNDEVFDAEGRLSGFRQAITSGEKKLAAVETMLDAYGIKINKCIVIGDSAKDIPMLKSAVRPVASPYATDEVKKIKGIIRLT